MRRSLLRVDFTNLNQMSFFITISQAVFPNLLSIKEQRLEKLHCHPETFIVSLGYTDLKGKYDHIAPLG
jgi:hypothetical protein